MSGISLSLTLLWDAVIRSFFIPIGAPLLLSLVSGTDISLSSQWALASILWGNVYAATSGGRCVGNVLWNSLQLGGLCDERKLLIAGVVSTACLQIWLAVANRATGIVVARLLTGFVCSIVCKCVGEKIVSRGGSAGTAAAHRASSAWSIGLVIGPLVGGGLYGKTLGLKFLQSQPGAAPCIVVGVLVCALAFFRLAWMPIDRRRSSAPEEVEEGLLSSLQEDSRGTTHAMEDLENGWGEAPARYVKAFGNNAQKRWLTSCSWRKDNNVDNVLHEFQPNFAAIKEHYPHALHGRSLDGGVVCWENPGKMNFGQLQSIGVTPAHLQRHFCFVNEFIWQRVSPGEENQLMTVLDVGGISLSTLKNNKVMHRYMMATAEIMQAHYPDRQSRIVLINAPWWFAGVWRKMAGFLTDATASKLQICGADFLPALHELIAHDQIPRDYGGGSPYVLGEAPEEVDLANLAASLANNISAPTQRTEIDIKTPSPASPSVVLPVERRAPTSPIQVRSRGSVNNKQNTRPALKEASSGWFSFGRNSAKAGTQAYLGEENRFVYDVQRQMWVLQDSDREKKEESASAEEDEEAEMIKAIQAAQLQLSIERERKAQAEQRRSMKLAGLDVSSMVLAKGPVGLVIPGRGEGGYRSGVGGVRQRTEGRSNTSCSVARSLTILQYASWCAVQAATEGLLPLWALSPKDIGGLGLTPFSVGLALALAGALLAIAHAGKARSHLARLPLSAPLRVIRLSAATLGILVLSLRLLLKRESVAEAVIAVAVAAAMAYLSTSLARTSSSTLLQLTWREGSQATLSLMGLAAALGEVIGPLLAVRAFAWSVGRTGDTGLEKGVTWSLTIVIVCVCCLLYVVPIKLNAILHGRWNEGSGGGSVALEGILEIPVRDINALINGAASDSTSFRSVAADRKQQV